MQNDKRRDIMNDDNYVEWLVKRKDPAYAVPVKILMIVVCIFSVLLALQTVFGVIVMTIAGVATYFVFLNLSVEFEYLFAEGGLSVDRILGRAKRKKIFDCEKDDIQIVAPADSFVLKDYEKQGMKVRIFHRAKGKPRCTPSYTRRGRTILRC